MARRAARRPNKQGDNRSHMWAVNWDVVWRAFEAGAFLVGAVAAVLALQANQLARASLDATTLSNELARRSLDDQLITGSYQLMATTNAAAAVKLRAMQMLAGYGEPIVGASITCENDATVATQSTCTAADNYKLGSAERRTFLSNATLSGLHFVGATFENVAFGRVRLDLNTFSTGHMARAQFKSSSMRFTYLGMFSVEDSVIESSDLTGLDLSSATFTGVTLPYSNVSNLRFCNPSSERANRLQALETGQYDQTKPTGCLALNNPDAFAKSWFLEGYPPFDSPGTGMEPLRIGWVCPEQTDPPADAGDRWFDENCRQPDADTDFYRIGILPRG